MRKCKGCASYGKLNRAESGCEFERGRKASDRPCRAYVSRLSALLRGERK